MQCWINCSWLQRLFTGPCVYRSLQKCSTWVRIWAWSSTRSSSVFVSRIVLYTSSLLAWRTSLTFPLIENATSSIIGWMDPPRLACLSPNHSPDPNKYPLTWLQIKILLPTDAEEELKKLETLINSWWNHTRLWSPTCLTPVTFRVASRGPSKLKNSLVHKWQDPFQ